MKVLILGCGPSGLMAANAAAMAGAEITILSKRRKSHMNGAQYLHEPVMGMRQTPPFVINYKLDGTPEGYRYKVYGRGWDGTVSPEDMTASHLGWDIREAYDELWDIYSDYVQDWEATPAGIQSLVNKSEADLIVSTIPAPLLCSQGHQFRSTRIYSTDKCWLPQGEDNFVFCNGHDSPAWYRASRIQGWENTEWPAHAKPPVTPLWEVVKPLSTNCDCFPMIMRAGRYGNWKKGVLSHEVQAEVTLKCRTAILSGL